MTMAIRNKLPDDHPIKRGFIAFGPRRTPSSGENSSPVESSPKVNLNVDPMQAAADQNEQTMRELAMDARKRAQSAPK